MRCTKGDVHVQQMPAHQASRVAPSWASQLLQGQTATAQLGIELRRGTCVALTRHSTEPCPPACSATMQEDKQVPDWAELLSQHLAGREALSAADV